MDELIAKLEAVDSRNWNELFRLDWEIHQAIGNDFVLIDGRYPVWRNGGGQSPANADSVPGYTRVIDAAMMLIPSPSWDHIEIVFAPPGGWHVEIGNWHVAEGKIEPLCRSDHETAALAFCIAALKARMTAQQ